LAAELEGKAKVCKLNTENGQVVDTKVGVQPKEVLKSLLV